MITLFSIPKAFNGHTGVIQANAIRSWTQLRGCEVILFGEEERLAEAAADLGVRHVREILRNEHGTPMVSDAFARVRELASHSLIAYVNSDIVLTSDLLRTAELVTGRLRGDWLVVGQRHDIDIREPLDFTASWEERLAADVSNRGVLHGLAGIDYFLFPRTFPIVLPPFAVGRPGWDSWLIYRARALGIPLIDATESVLAVHQNHPPAYGSNGVEARQNARSAGGYYRMGTLRDADWRIEVLQGATMRISRRLAGVVAFFPPTRLLLAVKRAVQARLMRYQ